MIKLFIYYEPKLIYFFNEGIALDLPNHEPYTYGAIGSQAKDRLH